MRDTNDATYIHFPVHMEDPTAAQMRDRLIGHFSAQVGKTTDWSVGIMTLRIVAPHDAVIDAVHLYLAGKPVPWTHARDASA